MDALTPTVRSTRTDGNFRVPCPESPLKFTGERMTSAVEGQIEFEHYHRYCMARDLCDGRDVLDVASGEGYGAALLAGVARSVIGVEIDPEAVAHAEASYRMANLRFLQGDALALPLKDASLDVVICFETLEHLADHNCFLLEVRRVLRHGGVFVVSTPDRSVYSAPGSDPNPYHVLELTGPEFRSLLGAYFTTVCVLSQRPVLGSLLAAEGTQEWRSYERRGPTIVEATNGLARAHYLVGIATDGTLPKVASSVYLDWRRVHDVVQNSLRLPAAEASAAELVKQCDTAQAEAARAADAHAAELARQRDIARAEATLEAQALVTRQDRLRAEAAKAEHRLQREAAEHEIACLRSDVLAADIGRAAAEEKAAGFRQVRDAVIYSTSWRLLSPLHAVGNKHRRLARLLRRTLKVIWWTTTLQIGYQYMIRRRTKALRAATINVSELSPAIEACPPVQETSAHLVKAPSPALTESALPSRILYEAFIAWHGSADIYFPPVAAPEVSVIIPVYRGLTDLLTCLRSLSVHRATEPTFEVILLDDCPTEPVLWAIPDSGGLIKIANRQNQGFLLTCNRGAAAARGPFLCFLNSDTIVSAGWLRNLVEALRDVPGAALAGGMLLEAGGTIQSAGWRVLANGWGEPIGAGGDPRSGAYTYRRPVDCVTGACFMIPSSVFEELGGFDPLYAPAFYEEFDLAFRARERGLKVIYEPRSRVVHLGSASYGTERRNELSGINHAKFSVRFADVLHKHPWNKSDEFALRHAAGEGPVLLVVDYGVPQPDRHAGDVTMSKYLSLLAFAGWRVVFGPMDGRAEGPAAEALETQGIELIRRPDTIEQWLTEHGRHVREVWLARPEIASKLIGLVRAHTSARITYYTHDLHHLRIEREAELRLDPELRTKAERVRTEECAVFRAVDQVTSSSEDEAELIRNLAPTTPVTVLPPYYYEAEEIRARDAEHFAALYDVLFVGGFPHTPNIDAALFIANEVMPLVWRERPDARLMLVGYAPPPEVSALACPRIVVTGQVPKVEPFLDHARVVLVALRYGAGVKGKTVDALRLGVPVVATPIGVEGIGIEPGREAIVAEDAEALAKGVLELFRDPERCAALSDAGTDLVRRRFSRAAARAAIGKAFRTSRCGICGSGDLIAPPPEGNFRECFVCRNCFALGRAEALGRIMLDRLADEGETSLAELARRRPDLCIHEFGFVGGVAETLRGQPCFTVSEYFDGVPLGAVGPGRVRCEDLTQLTFANDSFDLVISQDVMEHVPDPVRGFAETARVLRPGGSHIFTIPQSSNLAKSVMRAKLDASGVEHILPPEYHGDPVRAEGALVFTDFGADLGAILEGVGLHLIEHDMLVLGGSVGQAVRVFEAVKPTIDGSLPRRLRGECSVLAACVLPEIDAAGARLLYDIQDRAGIFESLIERCYTAELRLGSAAVDGGAHAGMHTAPMAHLVGSGGRVLAFEPVPSLAAELRQQFAATPQVRVYEMALSDREGTVSFQHIVNEPSLSSLFKRDLGSVYPDLETKELEVEQTTLDRFADVPVCFIKLDLEGNDYLALRGAQALLERHRPLVAFECNRRDTAAQMGYDAAVFFGFFASVDYRLLDLFGRPFGPVEFDLPWNAREVPHYVIAVPAERADVAPRLRAEAWALLQSEQVGRLQGSPLERDD